MESLSIMEEEKQTFKVDMDKDDPIDVVISRHRKSIGLKVYPVLGLIAITLMVFAIYLIIWIQRPYEIFEVNDADQISEFSIDHCGNSSFSRRCVGSTKGPCKTLPRQRRIVSGHPARKYAWPWMVELLLDNKHYCGGVLLSPRYFLSAGHCLFHMGKRIDINRFQAKFGSYNRIEPEKSSQSFGVEEVFIKNNFDIETLSNDIAVLKLTKAVVFNEAVWPICLPTGTLDLKDGTMSFMTGWGQTGQYTSFSQTLLQASAPLVSLDICQKRNGELFENVPVSSTTNICAGYGKIRSEYGCDGDSGGPLMTQTRSGKWIVIGVMSWGDKSCSSVKRNTYTVFTRVTSYTDWIRLLVSR